MTDPRALLDAHARLDAFARNWKYVDRDCGSLSAPAVFAAVRAVLDLHKPNTRVVDQWTKCRHCNDSNGDNVSWPCPTVQAIVNALEGAE